MVMVFLPRTRRCFLLPGFVQRDEDSTGGRRAMGVARKIIARHLDDRRRPCEPLRNK
jgi:hypothetical protein